MKRDSSHTPSNEGAHLDVWYFKPRLYVSNTGRWCCRTEQEGGFGYHVGNGLTPSEAWEDMKRAIVGYLKRTYRASAVEFV